MGKLISVLVIVLAVGLGFFGYKINEDAEPPSIQDYFWGPSSEKGKKADESIRPFKISISEKVLNDLKSRLKTELSTDSELNRYAKPLEGIGFEYGFNTNFLQKVGRHWLEKYDWKEREKKLNQYPHFLTKISGIDIHFLRVKSSSNQKYKSTKPLLLVHGWPGSFVEFYKVIPMLIDPPTSDFNFELIIPSLPGYGFSEAAHVPGLGTVEAAQLFHKLMKRLGFSQYYAQGGDWGSLITSDMAALYPKEIKGLHSNMCASSHPKTHIKMMLARFFPSLFLNEEEKGNSAVGLNLGLILRETGYFHIQATKPDTVGASLSNSPTGLAAYILEKFSGWTNGDWISKEDGGLIPYFNLDELLDNVMIYWVTNSITTSMRFYSESLSPRQGKHDMDRVPIKVPAACLSPKYDLLVPPQFVLTDKYHNLVRYNSIEKGGHFTAFEVPKLLANDVIEFVKQVEGAAK